VITGLGGKTNGQFCASILELDGEMAAPGAGATKMGMNENEL